MLYSGTHFRFTKSMFPFVNNNLIKEVNHQIDNPKVWQNYANSMMNSSYKRQGLMKNPYDIFGLTQSGHRSKNHDLLTGSLLASVQAAKMGLPPSHGIMSMYGHYAADVLSNKMVNKMGVEGRNIFEAMLSMNSRRNNPRRRRMF